MKNKINKLISNQNIFFFSEAINIGSNVKFELGYYINYKTFFNIFLF